MAGKLEIQIEIKFLKRPQSMGNRAGSLSGHLCLFVCLLVSGITQIHSTHLRKIAGVKNQGRAHYVLERVQITGH